MTHWTSVFGKENDDSKNTTVVLRLCCSVLTLVAGISVPLFADVLDPPPNPPTFPPIVNPDPDAHQASLWGRLFQGEWSPEKIRFHLDDILLDAGVYTGHTEDGQIFELEITHVAPVDLTGVTEAQLQDFHASLSSGELHDQMAALGLSLSPEQLEDFLLTENDLAESRYQRAVKAAEDKYDLKVTRALDEFCQTAAAAWDRLQGCLHIHGCESGFYPDEIRSHGEAVLQGYDCTGYPLVR